MMKELESGLLVLEWFMLNERKYAIWSFSGLWSYTYLFPQPSFLEMTTVFGEVTVY